MPVLRHGHLDAQLLPHCGGAFGYLRWKGQDLLRPHQAGYDQLPEGPRHSAGYVLAPYSNRIADAAFVWEGQAICLRPNFGQHPHSLHGFAWQRGWRCQAQSSRSATLVLDHPGDADWPWQCRVTQQITLGDRSLTLSLDLENLDTETMPAGLGWHPYFYRTPGVQLCFSARHVWVNDDRQLPWHQVPVAEHWDFRKARPLGVDVIDNCYVGWSREALIYWPEYRLTLSLNASASLGHLVLFTPQGRDFFGVEPVSHANAALNHEQPHAQGIKRLSPGERLSGHLTLKIEEDDERI